MENTLTGFTKVKHEVIQQALYKYKEHCDQCAARFKELKQLRIDQHKNSFTYKYFGIGKWKSESDIVCSFDPAYGIFIDFSNEFGGVRGLISDCNERDELWEWWYRKLGKMAGQLKGMTIAGNGESYLTGEACQFISRFCEGYDKNKV